MPQKLLMHKDTVVAEISISKNNLNVNAVTVKNPDLFPYANDTDINSIRRWILNRKTAINRKDILPLIRFYGEQQYTSDNLCSLLDCYWLKDKDSPLTWNQISPYQQTTFENDSIFLSIIQPNDFEKFIPNSPNLTLSKKQPLFWHILEDTKERGLLNFDAQIDMNLWKCAQKLHLDIVKERIYLIIAGYICTFTVATTNEDIEKIPFHQLYLSVLDATKSKSENLKECCKYYNIPNWQNFLNQIIEFNKHSDMPIDIMDIGVLRNTKTLEYIGFDKI